MARQESDLNSRDGLPKLYSDDELGSALRALTSKVMLPVERIKKLEHIATRLNGRQIDCPKFGPLFIVTPESNRIKPLVEPYAIVGKADGMFLPVIQISRDGEVRLNSTDWNPDEVLDALEARIDRKKRLNKLLKGADEFTTTDPEYNYKYRLFRNKNGFQLDITVNETLIVNVEFDHDGNVIQDSAEIFDSLNVNIDQRLKHFENSWRVKRLFETTLASGREISVELPQGRKLELVPLRGRSCLVKFADDLGSYTIELNQNETPKTNYPVLEYLDCYLLDSINEEERLLASPADEHLAYKGLPAWLQHKLPSEICREMLGEEREVLTLSSSGGIFEIEHGHFGSGTEQDYYLLKLVNLGSFIEILGSGKVRYNPKGYQIENVFAALRRARIENLLCDLAVSENDAQLIDVPNLPVGQISLSAFKDTKAKDSLQTFYLRIEPRGVEGSLCYLISARGHLKRTIVEGDCKSRDIYFYPPDMLLERLDAAQKGL